MAGVHAQDQLAKGAENPNQWNEVLLGAALMVRLRHEQKIIFIHVDFG